MLKVKDTKLETEISLEQIDLSQRIEKEPNNNLI